MLRPVSSTFLKLVQRTKSTARVAVNQLALGDRVVKMEIAKLATPERVRYSVQWGDSFHRDVSGTEKGKNFNRRSRNESAGASGLSLLKIDYRRVRLASSQRRCSTLENAKVSSCYLSFFTLTESLRISALLTC